MDREKIIKGLHDTRRYLEDKEWVDRGASPHIDSINDALALLKEQETKTGHWVSVKDGNIVAIDNDGYPEQECFCSECKKYLTASDEYAVYGKYCPYCGAKMESR